MTDRYYDIIRRNPYARAEYIGTQYAQEGECGECGAATNRWWLFEKDGGGRRAQMGYFCDFKCLTDHHGIEADEWE